MKLCFRISLNSPKICLNHKRASFPRWFRLKHMLISEMNSCASLRVLRIPSLQPQGLISLWYIFSQLRPNSLWALKKLSLFLLLAPQTLRLKWGFFGFFCRRLLFQSNDIMDAWEHGYHVVLANLCDNVWGIRRLPYGFRRASSHKRADERSRMLVDRSYWV